MNLLFLSGYGIAINVNKTRLQINKKDNLLEFFPHQILYNSIIIDGNYGLISFEAIKWLSKHDIFIAILNRNGDFLSAILPKETKNRELRIKQYEKYINESKRIEIAEKIIKTKIKISYCLLENLLQYYEIDLDTIEKEIQRIDFKDINDLIMYEGKIASACWNEIAKVFNKIANEFNFRSRKNLTYSWNMNASDQINALLNYGYAILESMIRKYVNDIGLDPLIGFLHEIALSKFFLIYDLQELFRFGIDYSVIQLLESGLKKSDFIITENYHVRLKPDTEKNLIEKIKNNFNQRYNFKNKKYTLENIMFENIREFSKFILDKKKSLEFKIPEIEIKRNYKNDNLQIIEKILLIEYKERKKLIINKSTLWYQQKKIKEGKSIKIYYKFINKIEQCGLCIKNI